MNWGGPSDIIVGILFSVVLLLFYFRDQIPLRFVMPLKLVGLGLLLLLLLVLAIGINFAGNDNGLAIVLRAYFTYHWISFIMLLSMVAAGVGASRREVHSQRADWNRAIPEWARTIGETEGQRKTDELYWSVWWLSVLTTAMTFVLEFFDWFHTSLLKPAAILVMLFLLLGSIISLLGVLSPRDVKGSLR